LFVAVECISMSSANSDASHPSFGVGKSDIIMLNNSGLRTLPWGYSSS
jgi:hypothetical protein